MKRSSLVLKLAALTILVLAVTTVAEAQATRTWVSGVGNDANPCSRTAPCKTFAGAISKTAKDGEINCLDPGGYGAVTITKSITIDCEDTQGSILASLTNGVIINITDAADVRKAVRLRGISINGASTGLDGIRVLSALTVHFEELVIDGFTGDGIEVNVGAQTTKVEVWQSSIRNCVGNGVIMTSANVSGRINANFHNVQFSMNGDGIEASSRSHATVIACSFSNNTSAGIRTSGTADAEANADNSSFIGNANAMRADVGTLRASNNLVMGNNAGLVNGGGTFKSYGTNEVDGNGGLDTSGVITPVGAI